MVHALTFSLIRAETERANRAEQVLINVNHHLRTMNASGMFVTFSYAVLDFWTGSLKVFRAGHLQPIVMERNGRFVDTSLKEGQPLGLFENFKIDFQEYKISPGGMAFLYSDGLNEAVNAAGCQFGTQRIREILTRDRQHDAQKICDNLWSAVEEHCGDMPHQDDFTTVLIKRL
ncbi:serine/threonine-protein phosphatase [bacterium]|nr:serine/threonine-protein phosphatase [bacterium]